MKAHEGTKPHTMACGRISLYSGLSPLFWESQLTLPIQIRMCWRGDKSSCFTLNSKYHYHHLGQQFSTSEPQEFFKICST